MIWYAEQDNQTRPAEGKSGLRPFCVPTLAGFFIGDKMKQIPLTQGQFAIVDNELYDWLNLWKWRVSKSKNTYYAVRSSGKYPKQHTILMHREIMNPRDDELIDHINHKGFDNRVQNMRICSHQQNIHNQLPQSNRTSIYKGVSWHKREKCWYSQIKCGGKTYVITRCNDEMKAAKAYDAKAKELFGEFAYINF